jgi:hypothetical protein
MVELRKVCLVNKEGVPRMWQHKCQSVYGLPGPITRQRKSDFAYLMKESFQFSTDNSRLSKMFSPFSAVTKSSKATALYTQLLDIIDHPKKECATSGCSSFKILGFQITESKDAFSKAGMFTRVATGL